MPKILNLWFYFKKPFRYAVVSRWLSAPVSTLETKTKKILKKNGNFSMGM